MTGGGLLLVFDKPVLASSLNCSALTFFSSTASGAESVALLEPCINPNADGDRLQLTLWPSDVERIKASRSVCGSGEATWLSMASWLVQDMFGNPAAALNRSQALPVSGFTPDVTGPVLLSWDLYKDQRRLRLHFDEPVNVSTLEVGGVTLQGFSTRLNLPFYTLTPASSSGAYNDTEGGGGEKSVVDVSFGSTDAAQVHARRARMGSTQANSYLLLSKLTIRDMAGNRNQVGAGTTYLLLLSSQEGSLADEVLESRMARLVSLSLPPSLPACHMAVPASTHRPSWTARGCSWGRCCASSSWTWTRGCSRWSSAAPWTPPTWSSRGSRC